MAKADAVLRKLLPLAAACLPLLACQPEGGDESPPDAGVDAGPSDADAGACPGAQRYCCPFGGEPVPFAATCAQGRWSCPGTSGLGAGTPGGRCCLADAGTVATQCVGDIIQCPYGAVPGPCEGADAGPGTHPGG